MELVMKIFLMGIAGAVISAVLWVAFFTLVVDVPAHDSLTPIVFILGGFAAAFFALKGIIS